MATTYERLKTVESVGTDGVKTRLALQRRLGSNHEPFITVSWRTQLYPDGPNRRFYRYHKQPWSIDASVALALMRELRDCGGLDDVFLDRVRRPDFETVRSNELSGVEVTAYLDEVTAADEDWGDSPFFVILHEDTSRDPNKDDWRKILIVDTSTGRATFRSTTLSTTYRPRATLREGLDWVLDNSMVDMTVNQTRVMLARLESLLAKAPIARWEPPVVA